MKFNILTILAAKLSVFRISMVLTLLFIVLAFLVEHIPEKVRFLSAMSAKNMVDRKLMLQGSRPIADDIIMIDVDDKSFEELGKWPWKRSLFAEVLDSAAKGGPKVIAMDLVYDQADVNTLSPVFNRLLKKYKGTHRGDPLFEDVKSYSRLADQDIIFSEKIREISKNVPVVLGYFFFFKEQQILNLNINWKKEFETIAPSAIASQASLPAALPLAIGVKASVDIYAGATPHHAFFDVASDIDGTVRRAPFLIQYGGKLFPSLGLKTVALALGKEISVEYDEYGIQQVNLGDQSIPTTAKGEFWVNYAGPTGRFKSVSFLDVLQNKVPSSLFKDKVVLLGITAKVYKDTIVTPVDNAHTAMEINANLIENLLHQNYLKRSELVFGGELIFILVMGFLLAILYHHLTAFYGAVLTVGLMVSYVVFDYQFLFLKGHLANSFIPALHLLSVFLATSAYKHFLHEKRSKKIRGTFERYVAPSVVEEMLKNPDALTLGGKKKDLTVLFSDICDFTGISEDLPADVIQELLNGYMTEMTHIVIDKKGMLDKYVGDEIMAIWGAPIEDIDHCKEACEAAILMIQKLAGVRKVWMEHGAKHLDIGIGINTGEMIVGNMGSEEIFDFTAVGDPVNLGARLERCTRVYKVEIIVSQAVYEKMKHKFSFRPLDLIRVRGKKEPTMIYELFASKKLSVDDLEVYLNAFKSYAKRNWEQALAQFIALAKIYPKDTPIQLHIERCKKFIENPPASDWDGVISSA